MYLHLSWVSDANTWRGVERYRSGTNTSENELEEQELEDE